MIYFVAATLMINMFAIISKNVSGKIFKGRSIFTKVSLLHRLLKVGWNALIQCRDLFQLNKRTFAKALFSNIFFALSIVERMNLIMVMVSMMILLIVLMIFQWILTNDLDNGLDNRLDNGLDNGLDYGFGEGISDVFDGDLDDDDGGDVSDLLCM